MKNGRTLVGFVAQVTAACLPANLDPADIAWLHVTVMFVDALE